MKVSLVIQDLFCQGAQYVTAVVARGFVQRGYEVDMVVGKVHRDIGRERPELTAFEVPDAVRWIHLKNRKASRNILELVGYIKRERPDVVFTMCSTYDKAVGLALWLCGRSRPIFLPVEHGAFLEIAPRLNVSQRLLNWLWCYHVDLQLAVSRGVKNALVGVQRRFPADKVFVVDNPAIDEVYWQKVAQRPNHPWLSARRGKVFVAAGAHDRLKGYDILIRAFSKLADKSARLIIFGDGPETASYSRLIA